MPGVQGTFSVENHASAPLRDMRAEARSTKTAFRELGAEMDKVGLNTAGLDHYKSALSDLRGDARETARSVSDSFDKTAVSVGKSVGAMRGELDDLQVKMKEVSNTRMTPNVDLRGVDQTLAKLALVEARLREINRQSARPNMGMGGGGGITGYGPTSGFASAGSFSGPLSAAASDVEGLGSAIPSVAIKAAAALPVIESLVGATTALVSSMTGAALGVGGVGLAAGGSLAVGLGSVLAVAKPTLTAIENVFKAESSLIQARQQATMPGLQQTQQLRQVVQAENALQQAQVQSRLAQVALTEARRQARNSLVNLGTAAQSAALGERQAALVLAQSQRSLYEAETSPTSTPLQIQQAELAVRQARLGVTTSRQQDKEAHEALAIGRRQGVEHSPQVMSARNAEQQSVLAIRNARWSVEEARKQASGQGGSVEQARRAYNEALSKAPPGTRELIAAGRDFIREWKSATRGASQDFIGILGGTITTARAMMPTLAGASNRDMGALRRAGAAFGGFLTSGQNQGFITQASETFAEDLPAWERSLTNIAGTVEHIAEAARPFLHEASVDFERWTASWDRTTGNLPATRATLGHMVEDARDWTKMWMAGWRLLDDIMKVGGASTQGNNMLATFTRTMDRWDVWVKENPRKVRDFFRQTREGAEGLAKAVGSIAHDLTNLASQLQPLMRGGLGILGLLQNTGLTSSVGGLGGLYGLYRGARGGFGAGGGGGRVATSPGASAARGLGGVLMFGGLGGMGRGGAAAAAVRGERVGNVRTAAGRPVTSITGELESEAALIDARAAAAAGTPFVSIAERGGVSRLGRLRGLAGAGASRVGGMLAGGARIAAPYLALNDALSIAGGQNPFKGSSPVSGVLGGIGQGALMGAAAGSVVPVVGTGVGALVGGAGGLIAGVASNAGALHRDIFGASASEKSVEGWERLAKQIAAVGGHLNELEPRQLRKLNEEAVKLQKQGSPALHGVAFDIQKIIGATGKSAQESARWSHQYSGSVAAMASASHRSLGEVVAVANTTAEGIKQELGGGSAQARETLARNFTSAAQIVQQRMEETGKFTREGIAIVNRELDQALSEYGLHVPKGMSPSAKEKAEVLKFRMQGDKTAGFGKGGQPQDLTPSALARQEGRATGGRLPGRGRYDTVRMSDGGYGAPGELVIPWQVEAQANLGLARAAMPSLGEMVGTNTIPHSSPYRATGGRLSHYDRLVMAANRVSAHNFPYRWGGGHEQPAHLEPFDCSGAVSYAAQQAGYGVPTTVAQSIGSWGLPAGEGAATIFYRGGPEAHTFMRIGGKYWGTSGFARPGGGAGWFDQAPSSNYLALFNKVHLPNLGADSVPVGLGGQIALRAPRMSGVGLLGSTANTGLAAYASGLSRKLNAQLTSTAAPGVTGGAAGSGDPLKDSLLAGGGGQRVGASFYGGPSDPSSGVTGYRGDNLLQHPDSYAELNMGHALGGLPYLAPLKVSYGGRSMILKKRDIGLGGGPVNGYPRALDLWYQAAGPLGLESAGLGVVNVQRMATGGRIGAGGVSFVGGFQHGGQFTTRPGKPVAFVAGEGSSTEDVKITPRRHAHVSSVNAKPTIQVTINMGDVSVKSEADFKKVLDEASDEAARKLIAAFHRREDRQVAGTVAD